MIEFDSERGLFHLRNDSVSLALWLRPDEEGKQELLTAYLGAPLCDPAACLPLVCSSLQLAPCALCPHSLLPCFIRTR